MRKTVISLTLLITTLFATGCPRYDAVRRMSAEALDVQQKALDSKTVYFVALDKFLDRQAQVAGIMLDSETENQVSNRNAKLALQLSTATDEATKQNLIAQSSADIVLFASDTASKKQQIQSHVALIKQKHNEILAADVNIYDAYVELDRWIQVKKVDEVLAEQVVNKLKVNQQKSTAATKDVTVVTDTLNVLLGGKK